jgi:alpha-D-ribose 1-methylphosphonate 5-triphosphate synthase subunit PhnG
MNAQMDMPHDEMTARRAVLRITVRATRSELENALAMFWPDLTARDLRPAESGLTMLRGRIGGDGAPFNLGEMTMSRAAVVLCTGEVGHGHVLGREPARARLIAIIDALWQRQVERAAIEAHVLEPVRSRLMQEQAQAQAQTAATKVDFFTLVRGED